MKPTRPDAQPALALDVTWLSVLCACVTAYVIYFILVKYKPGKGNPAAKRKQ